MAADRILRVIRLPGISDVLEFAEGRVRLFGMNIEPDNWVVGNSMAELDRSSPPKNSLMAIIFRGRRTLCFSRVPFGEFEPGDAIVKNRPRPLAAGHLAGAGFLTGSGFANILCTF